MRIAKTNDRKIKPVALGIVSVVAVKKSNSSGKGAVATDVA